MRILYHHRTRSKDGQDVHITEMIRALTKLGHEVIVVAPPSGADTKFGDDGGAVTALKRLCPRFVYELMEFAYSLVVYRRLRRAIRAHHPDFIYERYNLFLPAGVWAKRRFKLPLMLEVNGPLFEERVANEGIALAPLARWSQRYAWRGADYVLPVTQVLAEHIERAGVERRRIVVIQNGIDPEQFGVPLDGAAAKRALGLDGRLVLGFTGFVREWHGLDRVIDLLAKMPTDYAARTWHLLVVGDGPARVALEAKARNLGVTDRVTFTGIVARERIPAHVAAFDIALQPAAVAYASPLKLFEYMALGRAVIAPAQPNILEILTDGENAVLFDPADPQALGSALARLCGDDRLRARVGAAARHTIEARHLTWNDNAARVAALFVDLNRGALQR